MSIDPIYQPGTDPSQFPAAVRYYAPNLPDSDDPKVHEVLDIVSDYVSLEPLSAQQYGGLKRRLADAVKVLGAEGRERRIAQLSQALQDLLEYVDDNCDGTLGWNGPGEFSDFVLDKLYWRSCYASRGWHGARNPQGRCPDCGEKLPPGPPDSPRPKRPDVS